MNRLGYDPPKTIRRSNPNLGKNAFAKWAQAHFGPFSILAVLAVCLLKTFFSPLEPLVTHIVLMTLVLIAAYFLGFNKPGVGRTVRRLGESLRLALPVLVVGAGMLGVSVIYTGEILPFGHNLFDVAYYLLYFFAMCYLQDAVLCGMMCNVLDKITGSAVEMQKRLMTPCALWSLFYLLNGPSNATIAQIFGSLMMSLFLCSVYLRVTNLWGVVIAHGLCYCLMAGEFLLNSAAFSILTSEIDLIVTVIYLVLNALLLIPFRRNLDVWAEEKQERQKRLGIAAAEKKEKKEKTVIRKGIKQKHNR